MSSIRREAYYCCSNNVNRFRNLFEHSVMKSRCVLIETGTDICLTMTRLTCQHGGRTVSLKNWGRRTNVMWQNLISFIFTLSSNAHIGKNFIQYQPDQPLPLFWHVCWFDVSWCLWWCFWQDLPSFPLSPGSKIAMMEDGRAGTQQHLPFETADRRWWKCVKAITRQRRVMQTRYHGDGVQVSDRQTLFGQKASGLCTTYLYLKEDGNRGGEDDCNFFLHSFGN